MRLSSLVVLLLLAGFGAGLRAQAVANVTGTVPDDRSHMLLFEVDFGAMSQSVTLELNIGAIGGSSGLDVNLVDLDELAANGSATGMLAGADGGIGTITLNMTTPSYSGVRQFAIEVETDSENGPSPYTGTLECATLGAGAIVHVGTQTWPYAEGYTVFFNRAARLVTTTGAVGTYSRDVNCDFGASAQAATFWLQGLSFFDDGTMEVYEVNGGVETLLGTVDLSSGTGWEDEGNFTTSSRSGPVTLRVKVNSAVAGTAFFAWTIVMPDAVSIVTPGGSSDGGDDAGCSTGGRPGPGLLLFGLLAALGLGARLRGSRLN